MRQDGHKKMSDRERDGSEGWVAVQCKHFFFFPASDNITWGGVWGEGKSSIIGRPRSLRNLEVVREVWIGAKVW